MELKLCIIYIVNPLSKGMGYKRIMEAKQNLAEVLYMERIQLSVPHFTSSVIKLKDGGIYQEESILCELVIL